MDDVRALAEWVHPAKSALLVVDMQNDFCHPEGAFAKRGLDISMAQAIVPKLLELMDEARAAGVPVVIMRVVRGRNTRWPALERISKYAYGPDWIPVFVEGTWGADLFEAFEPKPGDIRLDKNRYGAFTQTNLDLILRSRGVKNLILSGGATNVCLESTLREGFMLGYNNVVVEDASAATSQEFHEATLATARLWFGRVEKADDVIAEWRGRSGR